MSDRPPLARPAAMPDEDAELLETARAQLAAVYREGRHEVVAAFRMADGRIVTGVHVDGSARRSAVVRRGCGGRQRDRAHAVRRRGRRRV